MRTQNEHVAYVEVYTGFYTFGAVVPFESDVFVRRFFMGILLLALAANNTFFFVLFFLPYPFYLPNARMQTRRIKAGELRYLRSLTQSDLFKHSTIHFHCFQPHSLNARMLFISFERDALLSLSSSLLLARIHSPFVQSLNLFFDIRANDFTSYISFFPAAYCGKQCFIQVNATR